jgi:hypothetical protein
MPELFDHDHEVADGGLLRGGCPVGHGPDSGTGRPRDRGFV